MDALGPAEEVLDSDEGRTPLLQALRERATRRTAFIALAVALLAGVGYAALVTTVFTPARAVASYISALEADDAEAALALVAPAALDGADTALLTDEALVGTDVRAEIGPTRKDGDTALVDLHVDGAEPRRLEVVRSGRTFGIFPRWRVATPFSVLEPRVGGAALPRATAVQVDGFEVSTADGTVTVFPGRYVVSVPLDFPLLSPSLAVVATGGGPQQVDLPVEVDPSVLDPVQREANAYVDSCVKYRKAIPSGCPFRYDDARNVASARWSVDSYPEVAVEAAPGGRGLRVATTRPGLVRFAGRTRFDPPRSIRTAYDVEVAGSVTINPNGAVFLRPDPRPRGDP